MKRPRARSDPGIARCAAAAIVLMHEDDARIVEGCHGRRGIVMRSVVDHDDLEILAGLVEHGPDRLAHLAGAVVDRNDDAEERVHGARQIGAGDWPVVRSMASINRNATQAGASPSRKSDSMKLCRMRNTNIVNSIDLSASSPPPLPPEPDRRVQHESDNRDREADATDRHQHLQVAIVAMGHRLHQALPT